MNGLKFMLGVICALPITILCSTLIFTGCLLKWCEFSEWRNPGLIWKITDNAPEGLKHYWERIHGRTYGSMIILRMQSSDQKHTNTVIAHQLEHVRQYMRLGVFFPVVYYLNYIVIKLFLTNSHPHFDNILEIDARRKAGQIIDVLGAVKKIKAVKHT